MADLQEVFQSASSRLNFINALIRLAKADGVITDPEKNFFVNASVGLGLSDEDLRTVRQHLDTKDRLVSFAFENRTQTLYFCREALQLCYLDGHFSKAEKRVLLDLAAEWGIAPGSIDRIEKWVHEGLDWKRRGDSLLQELVRAP